MCPIAQADRHDGPGLVDELVPGIAAVLEDVVVGAEDAIGEPVVAHELPDVFDRVEFRRLWRQRHQGDVGLLADPGLILKPDLYRLAGRVALGDLVEALGEVFLNAARASASWA